MIFNNILKIGYTNLLYHSLKYLQDITLVVL